MHLLKLAFFSGAILFGTLPAIAVDGGFSAALRSSQVLAAARDASGEAMVAPMGQRIRAGAAVAAFYDTPEGASRVPPISYRDREGPGAPVFASYAAPEGSGRVDTASYRNPEGMDAVIVASFSHPEGTNSFQTSRSMTHEGNFEPVFA